MDDVSDWGSRRHIGAKMTAHITRRLALLVVFIASLATQVFAQGIVTGSISGTVGDQTGAAIANATVIGTETQTNRKFTAMTNNSGQYALSSMSRTQRRSSTWRPSPPAPSRVSPPVATT